MQIYRISIQNTGPNCIAPPNRIFFCHFLRKTQYDVAQVNAVGVLLNPCFVHILHVCLTLIID